MSFVQDVHVQVETEHGKIWTKAWSTGVEGLVVVYDADHDNWSLTHKSSGRAIVDWQGGTVGFLRDAAKQLDVYDWTLDADKLTAKQVMEALASVTKKLNEALENQSGITALLQKKSET